MRLFVAVYPSDAARDDLARFVGGLAVGRPTAPGRSVRLVPPDRWHVTLAFIGDVPDDCPPRAVAAIENATTEPPVPAALRLSVAGGGTFGRGRFVVLWAGLRGTVDPLAALARRVSRELRAARIPVDRKPFRPHLTLARPGDRLDRADLAADVAALGGYAGPSWTVDRVCLVRSTLGPQPRYEPVAEIGLTVAGS